MTSNLSIAFDEDNNIRVLEAEKFRESDHLKGLSMEFITKVISLD
jgi:intraflagellar transport protein 20